MLLYFFICFVSYNIWNHIFFYFLSLKMYYHHILCKLTFRSKYRDLTTIWNIISTGKRALNSRQLASQWTSETKVFWDWGKIHISNERFPRTFSFQHNFLKPSFSVECKPGHLVSVFLCVNNNAVMFLFKVPSLEPQEQGVLWCGL